ncbi:Sjogren's syndrome/scleroderma autoantigen 1 family protein [Haloarcula marina]|uniref:Sjogren's syndrome/scleroderma autoantigen 1 family protein n=1 Tax=Haloarcula marina TaxID=2961574 RepID=UPI0020B8655C|nr:Sjogren's syndrome/scleroderma autoantigen 1 family protein [Halomicroarcula marina]
MSDFDKEAEREKLRKKFEKEEQRRETTEQMSELLLKGATMTNAHCSDCGDPIFRYDGQEFCPTCQKPISRDQSEEDDADDAESGAESDGAEAGDGESGEHIEMANPSNDARIQFGGDEVDDGEAVDANAGDEAAEPAADTAADAEPAAGNDPAAADAARQPRQEVPSADPDRTPDERQGAARGGAAAPARTPADGDALRREETAGHDADQQSPDSDPRVSPRTAAAGSNENVRTDRREAESLLAATARRFAERAAAAEDPREAREHLAAAREAAEALDAVSF